MSPKILEDIAILHLVIDTLAVTAEAITTFTNFYGANSGGFNG